MNPSITLVNSLVDLTDVQPNQVLGSAILASDFSSKINKKNTEPSKFGLTSQSLAKRIGDTL